MLADFEKTESDEILRSKNRDREKTSTDKD